MDENNYFGVNLSDDFPSSSDGPGHTPELLPAFFEDAEVRHVETIIRSGRGRGRPKLDATKQQISVRLDADVLAVLRQNGPGWQTRINEMLRVSLGLVKGD
jgi:uncharacterized protein (DUF4415 family)